MEFQDFTLEEARKVSQTNMIDGVKSTSRVFMAEIDRQAATIATLTRERDEARQQLADSHNCLSTVGYLLGIAPDKWSTPTELWQTAAETMADWYRYGEHSNHAISCRDETALRALDFQVRQLREQLAALTRPALEADHEN